MSRPKDAGMFEAEVYRLRVQCKKRRAKHLDALKVLVICAEALEHALVYHPDRTPLPCDTLTDALETARRLVPKK